MDDRMLKFSMAIKDDTTVKPDMREALLGIILDSQGNENREYAFNEFLNKIFGKDAVDFDLAILNTIDPVVILDIFEETLAGAEN